MSEIRDYPFEEEDAWIFGSYCGIGGQPDLTGERGKLTQVSVTVAEIEIIVREYVARLSWIRHAWAVYEQVGSRDIRMQPYANMRIGQFIDAGVISEEEVNKIWEEVERKISKPPSSSLSEE